MTIRWEEELSAWNNIRNQPRFKDATGRENPRMGSVKEMLAYLYAYVGGADKVGNLFCTFTGPPMRKQMHKFGIPLTKGYNKRKSVLTGVKLEGRTAREVAEECGVTQCTVRAWSYKKGIKLKRAKK